MTSPARNTAGRLQEATVRWTLDPCARCGAYRWEWSLRQGYEAGLVCAECNCVVPYRLRALVGQD